MKRYEDITLSAQERAEVLVDEMTVEEQASQLRYDAPAVPRLGIPAYNWWNEGLHGLARAGVATMFPQAIALAAMFDAELVEKVAEIISLETRIKHHSCAAKGDRDIYKGLTLWSPNINLFRDPRWGRGHETYGEDPYLTAETGKAFVRGIQGNGTVMRAAACAKHFAVHSGPEGLRHSFDAEASPKDMEETYLPAFEALVKDAKVEGVMGAYNRVNGEPACASDYLMGKLRKWDFDGYFTSDCGAIRDFHAYHGVTSDAVQSAAYALKRGCDVNCGCTYVNVLAALQEGLVTEQDIRNACVHLMRTRIRLGMFDKTEYEDIPYKKLSCPEHKAVSEICAEKSMVLLKNNGILPLDETKIKTLAVIGPTADSHVALYANYFGTADRYHTFLEGIDDRFDGRVLFAEGCCMWKEKAMWESQPGDRYAEAVVTAEHADAVILCIGLDSTIEGEEGCVSDVSDKGDKRDLHLPAVQRELLKRIKATGKPLIVLCSSGSSLILDEDPDALLQVWYPGSEGGKAAAKILFGDVSPSGKLPVTFYEDDTKLPDFCDYTMKNRTYRFAENNVRYPFGYGLTYSKVVCTGLVYENGVATVTVENCGDRDTEDVVQCYIKDHSEHGVRNWSLCGYKRVSLKAGETQTVTISIGERAFTSVNEKGERAVFGNRFTLYAGTHQPDAQSCLLSGTDCMAVEITK